MQVFTDDGARIDTFVDGRKGSDAVVLIHGFPLARAIWDAQRDALVASAYVICPDLRGAGSSSVPEGPYLMETFAADIAVVLDAFGIDRATLVGHSMGGYVALAFARMFTERVARLALVCSRLAADTPEQAESRWQLAARVEWERRIDPVVEAYLPRLFAPQTTQRAGIVERANAIAQRTDPLGAAATLQGMALRASSEDIAGDLDIPVLIVAGAHDRVVPIGESRRISESFPQGRLTVCGSSGHLAMLEEPEVVSDELGSWLAETLA